ncbi:hypothetical protein [Halosimplex pelagicum]|nr:hypothetical protein [Halosimplex pelagicum]
MTESRERRLDHLLEATGENTKSKALDVAAEYYIRMAGGSGAVPKGQVHELMTVATDQGSVTPEEIATILDTDELPVEYERRWSVGERE